MRCDYPASLYLRNPVWVFGIPQGGDVRRLVRGRRPNACNLVVYTAADVLSRLVGGDSRYFPNVVYLEFENLASPGDPISYPTLDRSRTTAYYVALSGARDYLRVPLQNNPAFTSSDATKYAGNQAQLFAVSQGLVGVNGLPFSSANNSTVFGVALAADPTADDPTQDVLYAASYDDEGGSPIYVPKGTGQEVAVSWMPRFF